MAQRFWGIYQSMLNKSTFPMPLDELTDLQDHIRNELLQKFRYYEKCGLAADVHLLECLWVSMPITAEFLRATISCVTNIRKMSVDD